MQFLFDNNSLFDIIAQKMNMQFEFSKLPNTPFIGFDKVKHIFLQDVYQDIGNTPTVTEPLFLFG